jgi:hypothetical protein
MLDVTHVACGRIGGRLEQALQVTQIPSPRGVLGLLERLSGSLEGPRRLGQPGVERFERWLEALSVCICFGGRLHGAARWYNPLPMGRGDCCCGYSPCMVLWQMRGDSPEASRVRPAVGQTGATMRRCSYGSGPRGPVGGC